MDRGENLRDAAMVDVAKELGYDLSGTTMIMTCERLMAADAVVVFDERHRDAIEYWTITIGIESFCSISWHLMRREMWKTRIIKLQLYIVVWLNTLNTVVNDWLSRGNYSHQSLKIADSIE